MAINWFWGSKSIYGMWTTEVQNTFLLHCILYAKSLQCDNTTLEKLSQNSILKVTTKAHTQVILNIITIKVKVKCFDIPLRHLYVNFHVKQMALCTKQLANTLSLKKYQWLFRLPFKQKVRQKLLLHWRPKNILWFF